MAPTRANSDGKDQTNKFGPVRASVQASPSKFYKLFSKCRPYQSLVENRSSSWMGDLYFEIREQEVRVLTTEQTGVIQSRHVFTEDYFDRIKLESDTPVGVFLNARRQRDRMDMLNDEIRIELQGPEGVSLADGLVATDGRLTSWINSSRNTRPR